MSLSLSLCFSFFLECDVSLCVCCFPVCVKFVSLPDSIIQNMLVVKSVIKMEIHCTVTKNAGVMLCMTLCSIFLTRLGRRRLAGLTFLSLPLCFFCCTIYYIHSEGFHVGASADHHPIVRCQQARGGGGAPQGRWVSCVIFVSHVVLKVYQV